MAQSSTSTTTKRYAVVTGGNKGIGFEICRQLACNGIVVILTARDKNRGLEAVDKLKQCGISDDLLIFHQLDVLDSQSIACLADFLKTRFAKLDILVNNAGIGGIEYDSGNFRKGFELNGGNWPDGKQITWDKMATQSFDSGEQCVKTNYYGAKAMVEALSPLLQLSDSARIVNVASMAGLLENIPNEWAKGLLSDIERLSEDRVDEVLKQFLKDFKDGLLETKGWRTHLSAYTVAKAAMIAYTRILAIKYPSFLVNAVCPGFCRTDITVNVGCLTAAEGAESVVRLALLPNDGSSGLFYCRKEISCF
ncbi:(+)-neomenthol dehydrogenase-like isoform X2 [Mercurialis annua]|uniref:(+)-neomenthol dehydrogenase-like isoform X2 n=1 Tax=Mercurialis annua TaxID=3986 RepID=UPI0021607970|nr:(+)-neomenthol dehydrogenase-like isoform X2 [Mercurialis annua]